MNAIAKLKSVDISLKNSLIVCDAIRSKNVDKTKRFLQDLLSQKKSIEGKYYTKTVKKILEVLEAAEANAKQKNLDAEKLFVKIAKADRGEKFIRPKSRAKFRGREAKVTNIEIVLEEK